jgi:hypothetical protein
MHSYTPIPTQQCLFPVSISCNTNSTNNSNFMYFLCLHTDKKEKKIFLIYKEIQKGAVAKSYMRRGFLIYEKMRKYLVIYEEAVCHI